MRFASAAILVGFVLAAAILQVLATIKLGLASVDALARVAHQPAAPYLWGTLGAAVVLLVVWILRGTPWRALGAFALLAVPLVLVLAGKISVLGLAFHGESMLHHFTALLSAIGCAQILVDWATMRALGRARWFPIALCSGGVLGALAVHVMRMFSVPGFPFERVTQAATACALAGLLTALAVLWKRAQPPALRWVSMLLIGVLFLRVGLAGPGGLHGAAVPEEARTLLLATVVLCALSVASLFRPQAAPGVRGLVVLLSALATALLYLMYQRSFGMLEDGIGGLAQSLFAFPLPYPEYVAPWRVYAVCSGLFVMFLTVYGSLMAVEDRVRGTALALLLVTGLGLNHPQLLLMTLGGHLLWLASLLVPAPGTAPRPAKESISVILQEFAATTQLPAPVVLTQPGHEVIAVRGELAGTAVDVRARSRRGEAWHIRVRVGVPGRGRPEVELQPDGSASGARPAHPIQRTHRIRGSARALERVDDPTLDALLAFARARARFWSAGTEIELGEDLSALDSGRLGELTRALTRRA